REDMPAIRRKGDRVDVGGVPLEFLLALTGGDIVDAQRFLAGGDDPFAVRRKGQGGNVGGMAGETTHNPAPLRLPESSGRIVAGIGDHLAVGAVSQSINGKRLLLENMFLFGFGTSRIPESQGAIIRSGHNRFAIGRKAGAVNMAPVP